MSFAIGEPLLAFADSIFGTRAGQFDLGKVMIVGGFYIIAGLILVASAGRPWGSHPPVTTTDLVLTGIATVNCPF